MSQKGANVSGIPLWLFVLMLPIVTFCTLYVLGVVCELYYAYKLMQMCPMRNRNTARLRSAQCIIA